MAGPRLGATVPSVVALSIEEKYIKFKLFGDVKKRQLVTITRMAEDMSQGEIVRWELVDHCWSKVFNEDADVNICRVWYHVALAKPP